MTGLRLGVTTQEIRGLVGVGKGGRVKDSLALQDHFGNHGYYTRENTVSTSSTTTSQDPIYCDPLAKVSLICKGSIFYFCKIKLVNDFWSLKG